MTRLLLAASRGSREHLRITTDSIAGKLSNKPESRVVFARAVEQPPVSHVIRSK